MTLCKSAKNHFIAQESSRYFGFFLPVRKQDWFCFDFCAYKNFSQKKWIFIYECKFQWLLSARDNVHFFIFSKINKNAKRLYIHREQDTLQKARQFPLRFYIQKSWHFTSIDFLWNFWSWHLYTKSMIFCVTWRFYIQKAGHFAKRKTICVAFYILNIVTLRSAIFHWIFEFGGGGGGI